MPTRTLQGNIARSLRTFRRGVLLRRRWLAALCLGVAVAAGVQAVSAPPPPTVAILTAARDLSGGSVIAPSDVAAIEVAPASVPQGVITNPVGRVLAAPLRRGEPLTDVRVVAPSLVEGYPGLTAVPIRIPDPGVAKLLKVGDVIDLLATDPQGAGTRTVATQVRVLALPQFGPEFGPESGSGGVSGGISGTLIVIGTSAANAAAVADAAVQEFLSIAFSA